MTLYVLSQWIISLPIGTDMRLVRKLFDLWRAEAAKRGVQ